MVLIITGATHSDRNGVGRLLAETLGWEFVNAENLHPPVHAQPGTTGLEHANRTPQIETLSAAIDFWIYEWRDVVVSCATLPDPERAQLCTNTSLVRMIRLRTPGDPSGERTVLQPFEKVLTLDSAHGNEEIISEMISALILNRGVPLGKAG